MNGEERNAKEHQRLFGLSMSLQAALWILSGLLVIGVTLLVLWLTFGRPSLQSQETTGVTPDTLFQAAKLALTVVAGIGGVVALVVAYRRQRLNEDEHVRQEMAIARDETRLFTERFAQASQQLGSDQAAIRVAGVYAMAGLADDWRGGRQTCVDVLCAYLRMPYQLRSPLPDYEPPAFDSGTYAALRAATSASGPGRNSYPPNEEHQVRSTIISAMRDRMNELAVTRWSGLNFDFTGAVFEEASFDGFIFDQCDLQFGGCVFVGECSFAQINAIGSRLWFVGAVYLDRLGFELATFEDSEVTLFGDFGEKGDINFQGCTVKSGKIDLLGPREGRGHLSFVSSILAGGEITISGPTLSGDASIAFSRAVISGTNVRIHDGTYTGGNLWFNGVTMSGGNVSIGPRYPESQQERMTFGGTELAFDGVDIESGSIRFGYLDVDGSSIHFDDLHMSGGAIRFAEVTLSSGSIGMCEPEVTGGAIDLGSIRQTPAGELIASQIGEHAREVPPLRDGSDEQPETSNQ